MDRVKVGVIGYGYWGPNLVRNLFELPEANLSAVADLKAERREQISARYPDVTVIADYEKFFDMPLDAVVIATPPSTHYDIARDCLEHGLHVLVEKPLTLNSEDASSLIQIAEERDLALMVGHTFEYNMAVRELRDLIDSGELGKVFYVDAVRVNLGLFRPDLNVLWDLAPHDISILLYLLDSEPVLVSTQGSNCVFKDTTDIAYVNIEFADGTLAHIRVSWLDPRKTRLITVVGSEKMVVYDDVENLEKIKIYDKGVDTPPYTETYGDFQLSYRSGDVISPNIRFSEPLRVECEHFIESIQNGTTPQSDGRVGLKVIRVLEAAERSLYYCGMPVSLSWGSEESDQEVRARERFLASRMPHIVADSTI
jgi:predicted dehydrogenase